ncbi:putative metal-dependent peptidase [Allocatelliglobosispora scoriae]|uniref:Putative metal-dependent peptidase n=1 Tax=Allocatelliglobosispora scoriae TaxID=643052 RepID=A0A841BI56_9ACTN|nr:VWA-like domain-containing protein [Allocatelliglobosispora scoriae]MBB5868797.1 putative metal-dependent peptidase [Allocatelliglobosispora scoriae]
MPAEPAPPVSSAPAAPAPVLDRAKLLAARLRAASDRPYLASALYSLTVVPSPSVPTMGVDRYWRCYVNPAFVDAHPVAELAGVWIHEVAHLLRDHHGRADRLAHTDRQDHHRVNIAQDCEINDDLLSDRLSLPAGRVEPKDYQLPNGQLFEQYLPHIPAGTHHVNCGSGAHGRPMPWDLPAAGQVGEVEAAAIRRQTAQAIRSHTRSRGTVPAGWRRWADELLEPTVDWRTALTGAVREAAAWASGAADYTYHRPSRRGAALRGVILPSLRRPLPRVAIVVDTSGSMSDDALAAVLAEVGGVLRAVGVGNNRVSVLACDADVHATRRVSTVGEVVLAGGGGTDMRVGIEAALATAQRPNIVIVLTDGYTPWPEASLGQVRVIAGLVGEDAPVPPPWIESIAIPAALG